MYWIAFGDVHEQVGMLTRIPDLAGADGVIVSGDLTNRGGQDTARRVLGAIKATNPTLYAQIGNMDTEAVAREIGAQGFNLHRNIVNLTEGTSEPDLCLFGIGMSTFTPFGTPSEVSDDQLGQWLDQMERGLKEKAGQCAKLVAVIHDPPHGVRLDLVGGSHVGSKAVRAFLERVQPDLCISGHIHEAVGEDVVGRTRVLNPGMLAQGGYVRLSLVDGVLDARLEHVDGEQA